jgi:diaminopimelate decarboxylase
MVGGLSTVDLAAEYGTPLHVVNEERLQQTAQDFLSTIASEYPGRVSVHYPFKCNSVPAVVNALRTADLKAEVMTEFELELALRIGYTGPEIIVNGPCKTKSFLQHCIAANVRLIIVDSIPELLLLKSVAGASNSPIDVLLRVNPDYVPHGMNEGSATGSRRGCAFGLDLKGEEVQHALRILSRNSVIRFQGLHMHIGTGIRDPRDYGRALGCLPELVRHAAANGFRIRVLDTGGGFASMTTREFTSREMLLYGGFGKLPLAPDGQHQATFREFAGVLTHEITRAFSKNNLPELILEPGRCIASPNQFLLLSVHYTKERRGAGKWLITDGGLGTVTMPTYYEYHETFLCNDVNRRPEQKVTIVGPACFAGDVVYRNKWMPIVHPGEVLAIMDTGAYFTALESSFGFPRPAIVVVRDGRCQIARRRETFEDLIARDHIEVHQEEEVS